MSNVRPFLDKARQALVAAESKLPRARAESIAFRARTTDLVDGKRTVRTATTTADGSFEFGGCPEGVFRIGIVGNGWILKRDPSEKNDIVFAIGPAGTGKTYTAVALAVRALKNREIRRIILTRPAVEAGEHLGFLPGDLKEKIDPYLRPLYDALFDMIPGEKLKTFLENGVIEVAPLAFMRGRTLDHAYVILDEAQNATESQLKMFLTRMGPNAKMIVTGDMSQVDLPRNQPSGLIQATRILKNIDGIGLVFLDASDVVRHRLVKDIIHAYDKPINKEETK